MSYPCLTSGRLLTSLQWLTTHQPSAEHDLSTGLRDHFDPKARWRSAIASARAIHRLHSFGSKGSKGSTQSGGWNNEDTSDDEITTPPIREQLTSSPGSNEYVKVTAPDEEEEEQQQQRKSPRAAEVPKPTGHDGLEREEATSHPLGHPFAGNSAYIVEPAPRGERHHEAGDDDSVDVRMPGSFDTAGGAAATHDHGGSFSWIDMLKKLRLK